MRMWELKYPLLLVISIISICSCNRPRDKKDEFKLAGTRWESSFYCYHNEYLFETDSTGFQESSQIAGFTAIDLEAFGIEEDSLIMLYEEPITYHFSDSILTIERDERGPEATVSFKMVIGENREISFVSEDVYAYGTENLILKDSLK